MCQWEILVISGLLVNPNDVVLALIMTFLCLVAFTAEWEGFFPEHIDCGSNIRDFSLGLCEDLEVDQDGQKERSFSKASAFN